MFKFKRFWIRLALGVLLPVYLALVMPSEAWATTSCAGVSTGEIAKWNAVSSFVNIILSPINSAQSTITTKANTMATSATAIALVLAGVLALSYFLWGIIDSFAGSGESFMSLTVGSLIPAAIVAACLGSYSTLISTSGGLQGILSAFTTAATGSSSVSSSMTSYMQTLASTLAIAFVRYLQELGCVGVFDMNLALIGQMLLASWILLGATILSVIALAELVGVLLTGIVMVGIGVAVGPLFVACAVCKWSKGFFDGWLRFLLGASAYQMIISVVLTLVSSLVTAAQTEIATVNPANSSTSAGVSIAGLLGLLGMTWVMTHLFKDIPRIAAGLFGGGGVGHASFNRAAAAMAAAAADLAEAVKEGNKKDDKDGDGDKPDSKSDEKGDGSAGGADGGGGGGKGGSGGPTVTSETGSFTAAPQLASSGEGGDGGGYGGPLQLPGPDVAEGQGSYGGGSESDGSGQGGKGYEDRGSGNGGEENFRHGRGGKEDAQDVPYREIR